MRADLGSARHTRLSSENRERMDGRVGLELYGRLDPRGGRIDDGGAGEHVRLVDAVPERGRNRGKLGARVDPDLGRIVGLVDGDALALADQLADGVCEVELALAVLGA